MLEIIALDQEILKLKILDKRTTHWIFWPKYPKYYWSY